MSYQVRLVLPDEILDNLPPDRQQWIPYLARFFEDAVIKPYDESLQRRQSGVLGRPLSKYERTAYLDMLLDIALGQLRERIESSTT